MLEMQAMATESFIFSIQVDIAQYFGFRAPNMKKRKKKQKKKQRPYQNQVVDLLDT